MYGMNYPLIVYILVVAICSKTEHTQHHVLYGRVTLILGAKPINVFRACLSAQITICGQK